MAARKVGEWVDLIESCEAAGVLVHVTTHNRTYDPANARDRRSLLEDAVDSEYESGKTSARLRRAFATAAAEGRPGGRVPYGYERIYDPVTRRLVSQHPDKAEAPVVAELYARLREGHSLKAIARDFAGRGILTRGSERYPPRPFSPQYLREIALRPCYGGLRVHQPVTGPRRSGALAGAVAAMWPPLTDPETWHAVHAMLTDQARRTSRPGRAVHLLSLIARCGECDELLRVAYRRHGRRHDQGDEVRDYACRGRGGARINADALDEYAIAAMLAYLARPDVFEHLRAGSAEPAALAAVRAELAAARDELADWRNGAAAGRVTLASFAAVEPGVLEARQIEHEAKLIDDAAMALASLRESESLVPGLDAAVQAAIAAGRAAEDRLRAEDRKLTRVKSEQAATDPADGDAQEQFAIRIHAREGAVDTCKKAVDAAHDKQAAAQGALDRQAEIVTSLTAAYNQAKHKAENPGAAPGGSVFAPGITGIGDMDPQARELLQAVALAGVSYLGSSRPEPKPDEGRRDPSAPIHRTMPDGRVLVITTPASRR